MIKIRRLLVSLATLLLISTLLMACVNNPQVKPDVLTAMPTPEDFAKLDSRVLGRWEALIDRDFEKAYGYFSPAYRKLFPLRHYLSRTGSSVDWISADIKDSQYAGTRAEVRVEVDYKLDFPMEQGEGFGEISKELREIWLWVDGQWWYTDENDGKLG
jgi:hypothetical protein